jgi:catechol 2,3-dioxygenase-like lactoylglutathione lyase family enzyme
MATDAFAVERIDHVGVFAPGRYEAAAWYRRVLGLDILRGAPWENTARLPGGPLILANASGGARVALFDGEPLGGREPVGHCYVCFRAGGDVFDRFVDRLDLIPVYDERGERLAATHVAEREGARSLAFCDPYGNRYRIAAEEEFDRDEN